MTAFVSQLTRRTQSNTHCAAHVTTTTQPLMQLTTMMSEPEPAFIYETLARVGLAESIPPPLDLSSFLFSPPQRSFGLKPGRR